MNEFMEQFLLVIYPYVIAVIFIMGQIFRYMTDQAGWTTKSSEFLEKEQLKWGSLLFHFGILAVLGGHFSGLLVPKEWFNAVGVTDEMYHAAAVGGGGVAGLATLAGILFLTVRRFSNARVSSVSSFGDKLVVVVLLAEIVVGIAGTASGLLPGGAGFDYRETIAPWLRGLLIFTPDKTLMSSVPFVFRVHILLGLMIFAIWPFTRLVHVWSAPLEYISRAYIHYRTKISGNLVVSKYQTRR